MSYRLNCGFRLAVGSIWLAAAACCSAHSTPDEKGIHHFGVVNAKICRGETPTENTFQTLHRLGVRLIVDLRMVSRKGARAEQAIAAAHGMVYTNLPMPGIGRPRPDQVRRALDCIYAAQGPVYLFCRRGCDRTGLVIACYRIEHDHWSKEAALAEAGKYGLSMFERGMKLCIRSFGFEGPVRRAPRQSDPPCVMKAAERQREALLAEMAVPSENQ